MMMLRPTLLVSMESGQFLFIALHHHFSGKKQMIDKNQIFVPYSSTQPYTSDIKSVQYHDNRQPSLNTIFQMDYVLASWYEGKLSH